MITSRNLKLCCFLVVFLTSIAGSFLLGSQFGFVRGQIKTALVDSGFIIKYCQAVKADKESGFKFVTLTYPSLVDDYKKSLTEYEKMRLPKWWFSFAEKEFNSGIFDFSPFQGVKPMAFPNPEALNENQLLPAATNNKNLLPPNK